MTKLAISENLEKSRIDEIMRSLERPLPESCDYFKTLIDLFPFFKDVEKDTDPDKVLEEAFGDLKSSEDDLFVSVNHELSLIRDETKKIALIDSLKELVQEIVLKNPVLGHFVQRSLSKILEVKKPTLVEEETTLPTQRLHVGNIVLTMRKHREFLQACGLTFTSGKGTHSKVIDERKEMVGSLTASISDKVFLKRVIKQLEDKGMSTARIKTACDKMHIANKLLT